MSNGNGPARSRRELRQARDGQAEAPASPVAPAEPAVPPASSAVPPASPAVPPAVPPTSSAEPPASSAVPPAVPPIRSRRAAAGPVDAAPGSRSEQDRDPGASERSSQIRARNREALRASKAVAEAQAVQRIPAEAEPPPTRRQRRLQQLETGRVSVVGPAVPDAAPRRVDAPAHPMTTNQPLVQGPAPSPSRERPSQAEASQTTDTDLPQMTVEQALAARELLIGQAKNQVAMMEARQEQDPMSVDPVVLAQQRELAERAAILNRRAEAIQRIAEENEKRRPSRNDPTTAHNLAMITPLEFVQVPGMDRPVLKPPTTHVPIVTSATPKAENSTVYGEVAKAVIPSPPAATPSVSAPADEPAANKVLAAAQDEQPALRRSRVLAQAERMAGTRPGAAGEALPVQAGQAYGLDPLDADTAGLRRMRRMLTLQIASVALGTAALIVGLFMIVGGAGR